MNVNGSYEIIATDDFDKLKEQKKGLKMVDLPQIDEEVQVSNKTSIEDADKKMAAIRFSFVGAGQCGGNIVDAFYKLGYRRVAVVNTTARDMHRLSIPEANRFVMQSDGGAGKDPAMGRKYADRDSEEIFKLLKTSFGDSTEQIFVCFGAGGGTGDGASGVMIKLCKEYLASIKVQNSDKKVGVIVTLPARDESSYVQRNALECIFNLIELAKKGSLSPLILVDNAKVIDMYGAGSAVSVWETANKNIAALFDVFNVLASTDDASVHVAFDPQDFREVLGHGILAFGRTKLDAITKPTDVSDAVRNNVKKGLLVDGLDLSQATSGAGILVGNIEGLKKVSQDSIEGAFGSLNRLMKQGSETKLHRGIIESQSATSIYLYTIISGLGAPSERLNEMEIKAGKSYPK